MTSRSSPEELRTRAVEVIVPLIYPEQLAVIASLSPELREEYCQDLHIGAGKVLAAAEPFIRELVVEQIAQWLDNGQADVADAIRDEFGGSR